MVVYKGQLGSIAQDGNLHNLTWGHEGGIECPDADQVDAVDVVSGIEGDQEEHFPVSVLDEFEAEFCQVLGPVDGFLSIVEGSVSDHLDFYDVDLDRVVFFHVFSLLCVEIKKADHGKSAFLKK